MDIDDCFVGRFCALLAVQVLTNSPAMKAVVSSFFVALAMSAFSNALQTVETDAASVQPNEATTEIKVLRYKLVADGLTDHRLPFPVFRPWTKDRVVLSRRSNESGVRKWLVGLSIHVDYRDWWMRIPCEPSVDAEVPFAAEVVKDDLGVSIQLSGVSGRSATVRGFSDVRHAERVVSKLRAARAGNPGFGESAEDRSASVAVAWECLRVLGALNDGDIRFGMTTFLDGLDLSQPILGLAAPFALRAVSVGESLAWEPAADLVLSMPDSKHGFWKALSARHGSQSDDYARYRDELIWLESADAWLRGAGREPSFREAREWFARSGVHFNLYGNGPETVRNHVVRHNRNDLVYRVAAAMYIAAEDLDHGEIGVADKATSVDGPPYWLVDSASFVHSSGSSSLQRAEAFKKSLEAGGDRRQAFAAARTALAKDDVWIQEERDKWFPVEFPALLNLQEILRLCVHVDRHDRWQFLQLAGGVGLTPEAESVLEAKPGDVLGPFPFGFGWTVVEVVDIASERPSDMSWAAKWASTMELPPTPFPASLRAIRTLSGALSQPDGTEAESRSR